MTYTKRILYISIFIIAIVGSALYARIYLQEKEPTPSLPQTATSTPVGKEGSLEIFSLVPNQVIESPLTISGNARLWYFEASFPIEVRDGNDTIIGRGIATAQDNWMTTEFVPFKATVTFTTPSTPTGTIIFRKDNPSGEARFDESFTLPVRFNTQ